MPWSWLDSRRMAAPLIGISAWTRAIDTVLGDGERHATLGTEYVTAVTAVGGIPVILPTVDARLASEAVARLDGVIVSGGNDVDPASYGAAIDGSVELDPARDAWEMAVIRAASRLGVPLLGICRGAQVLNVAHGGTLTQHIWDRRPDHPALDDPDTHKLRTGHHEVTIDPDSILGRVYGKDRRTVNSLHHQAIDRLGRGLRVSATSSDGTIEALEATGGWVALAVQWHPERLDLSDEMVLFEAFVALAASRASAD